ncbi:hypothetical protein ACFOSW_28040 [Paenibacillus sp. GCM10012303]
MTISKYKELSSVSNSKLIIREVRQDDDFEQMASWLKANGRSAALHADQVRTMFFPKTWPFPRKSYVTEVESKIVAMMMLDLRDRHGVITCTIQEADVDHLEVLNGMLEKCADDILERGGTYLAYFAQTEFGQLQNRELYLLERLGFRTADEYMRISARLSMDEWEPPEVLDTASMCVDTLSLEEVHRILTDDGNAPNAIIFQHQFQTVETSNVILTLRNDQREITAIAYYKVKKVDPSSDVLSATAFNLHFRPAFELTKQEKRQFLQGVLYSMKQLDIRKVNSLMSLKHVDVFTLMVREGFDEIRSSFFALTKAIGSGHETV